MPVRTPSDITTSTRKPTMINPRAMVRLGVASMAWRLAQTGERILLIERGNYLPRERENWNTDEVFRKGRYQANETWTSSSGDRFKPGLHYFVGGNSKVYGGALFRLRETD